MQAQFSLSFTIKEADYRLLLLVLIKVIEGLSKIHLKYSIMLELTISPRIKNFEVHPTWWVVERPLSWFGGSRHLS